jgi:hypothetical protein
VRNLSELSFLNNPGRFLEVLTRPLLRANCTMRFEPW